MNILNQREEVKNMKNFDINNNDQELDNKLIVQDKRTKIEIIGGNFQVRISKFTGDITSIMYNATEYLVEPIRVLFDSNEVNEDIGIDNVNTILFKLMKGALKKEQKYKIISMDIDYDNDQVIIQVIKKVRNLKNGLITKYSFDQKGKIEIINILTPKKDIYRFGTTMTVCKSMNMFSWVLEGKGKSDKKKEKCKLIHNEYTQCMTNKSSLKYKIKAKKSNVKEFLTTDESGNGLLIQGKEKQLLSVRANYNSVNSDEDNEKVNRIKESIVINIEYRENNESSHISGVNYEEEYKLKRNNQYIYSYKISSAI